MSDLSRDYFSFFDLDRKLLINLGRPAAAVLQAQPAVASRPVQPKDGGRTESVPGGYVPTKMDGYRTLKDPVKRAEYLLTQEGFPIGEQRSKDVPPELLEEVFELNMMLEELEGR